jgi:GNAT superfamily N-acetyltransferase
MMELIYSRAALQKQIQIGHQFIIAYDEKEAVAFASYSPKENSPEIFKLQKIYILPNQQRKGIGKLLIHYITEQILPAHIIALNVNRHNKALHFYNKLGFKIIGEEDIDIGKGFYMNDYVMQLHCYTHQ